MTSFAIQKNIPKTSLIDSDLVNFFLLIFLAIGANYFTPPIVSAGFFIVLFYLYLKSENEALWFAFFLILSDGVFGFFGNYQALITALPGLPGIEVAQFYFVLTVVKAYRKKSTYRPFYSVYLQILTVYVGFLIVQGIVVGLTPQLNLIFRVVKQLIPFALFYSLPKLFTSEEDYRLCFKYIFPVVVLAFVVQLFTIAFGSSPLVYFGIQEEWRHKVLINLEVTDTHIYRGIYNECILLIGLFGGLFYLGRRTKYFSEYYLVAVISAVFLAVFVSATRGYMIGATMSLLLFLFFVRNINFKGMMIVLVTGVGLFMLLLSTPLLKSQITGSIDRMFTLEKLIKGDATAGGTLGRLTERGPRVMKRWRESPLTGWGFSDYYAKHRDMHVGNQSILLHSGVVGALLLGGFFFYYNLKLWLLGGRLSYRNEYKRSCYVFGIFFLGWFAVHSSTQYYFAYDVNPNIGMIQALFFSLGGLIYYKATERDKEIKALKLVK